MAKRREDAPRRRGGWLVNLLLVVSIAGLIVATVALVSTWLRYREASGEYEALQDAYLPAAEASEGEKERFVDLEALRRMNPDVVAWVELPETQLSYPVVQAADNDHYLYRTVEGTDNPSGSVFLDYRCAPDFSQANSVLYGHNMKDGSMFHTLQYYVDKGGDEYRRHYNTLYLYTDEGRLEYDVLWVRNTNIEDPVYRLGLEGEAADAWLEEMGGEAGDRMLTLSTCINNYDNETPLRIVMLARLRDVVKPEG